MQGTFFVPCQYNQADCHRKLVTERALGVASLSHLAGKPLNAWCPARISSCQWLLVRMLWHACLLLTHLAGKALAVCLSPA